jgi:hypothetical protein
VNRKPNRKGRNAAQTPSIEYTSFCDNNAAGEKKLGEIGFSPSVGFLKCLCFEYALTRSFGQSGVVISIHSEKGSKADTVQSAFDFVGA